jgi:hypothetical protein
MARPYKRVATTPVAGQVVTASSTVTIHVLEN